MQALSEHATEGGALSQIYLCVHNTTLTLKREALENAILVADGHVIVLVSQRPRQVVDAVIPLLGSVPELDV